MPVTVTAHPEGATVAVRAQPGARKTAVVGEQAGALKLAVTAPPEDGRANEAIVEVLKELFDVKRSQIELISGKANRNKVFLIVEETVEKITARLAIQ